MKSSRPTEALEQGTVETGTDRLDSWKEIARYLGRTVRTVQRWEKSEGLPVRRIQHDGGATVFAFRHELDAWLAGQGSDHARPGEDLGIPDPGLDARPRMRMWLLWLAAVVLGTAVWGLLHLSTQTAAPVRNQAFVPNLLTTQPGIERFPDLSPDGRQVVYTSDSDNGQVDVYLRMVDSDQGLRLTRDSAIEERPVWSPDGLSVAFLRRTGFARRALVVISALGGNERTITEFEVPESLDTARSMHASLAWFPGGEWLLFTRKTAAPETMAIVGIHLSTGREVLITRPGPGEEDLSPAFSPDGKQLAFTRSGSALKGEINVMGLDLSGETPAIGTSRPLPGAGPWNTEAAWTPDGKEIFFSSGRWPMVALWRVPADGSSAPRPVAGAGQGGAVPSLAALSDGSGAWRLVYSVGELDNDIWRFEFPGPAGDPSSHGLQASGPGRLLSSSQRERFPQYSPDGQRIAFLSDRSGHREIWVADAEGEQSRQWTDWESSYIWRPSWSPSGDMLAYTVEIDGVLRAQVQDGPMSVPRALTDDGAQDEDLAWSRDGSTIYLYSGNRSPAGPAIWALNLKGGDLRLLARVEGQPLGEGEDGKELYVSSLNQQGDVILLRIDLENGAVDSFELDGARPGSLTLGPGGIYFLGGKRSQAEVRKWAFPDGSVSLLARFGENPESGMAVSPDGRYFLVSLINLIRSDLVVADTLR